MNLKTHNCGKISKNTLVSYCKPIIWEENMLESWNLYELVQDSDFGIAHQCFITKINFCPFCGEKLENNTIEYK